MDIPFRDYDGETTRDDTDSMGEPTQQASVPPPSDRHPAYPTSNTHDQPSPNLVRVTGKTEPDIAVAQPILVESDRSKVGSKRRSQMQVVSIRLDSDSDSSGGRKYYHDVEIFTTAYLGNFLVSFLHPRCQMCQHIYSTCV